MKLHYLLPLLAASVALPLVSAQSETPPPPAAENGAKPPKPPGEHGNREEMAKKRMEEMKKNLGLSDEQVTQIAAIRKEQAPAAKAIKDDASLTPEQKKEKMKELRKTGDDKVATVLTPEQKTKWEEQMAKMKEGREKGGDKPAPAPTN